MSPPQSPTTLLEAAQILAYYASGAALEPALALIRRAAAAGPSAEPPYTPGLPPPELVRAHTAQGGLWMELYLDRADSQPRLVRLAYDETRQRVCEARNDGLPTYVLEDGPWAYRPCLPSGMPIFWAGPAEDPVQNAVCPTCGSASTPNPIVAGQGVECEWCKTLLVSRLRPEPVLSLEHAPWVQLRPGCHAETDNQGSGLRADVPGPFQVVPDGGGPLLTLRNVYGQITFAPRDALIPAAGGAA